jgi:large subunit ribosomal protein L18
MKRIISMRYRRQKSGKTDYHKRLRLLVSRKPRIVVRRSLRYITVQIVEYQPTGDKVLIAASSKELPKLGWKFGLKNTPASYLTGMLLAQKAKKKGLTQGTLDLGRYSTTKGNKLFACIKGLKDGGLQIKLDESILPSEDRICGKHIAEYAGAKNKEQFCKIKKNAKVEDITKAFDQMKEKLA